jgi:hypothetical protein
MRKEGDIVELLKFFGDSFNHWVVELDDAVPVKCVWDCKHWTETGIPEFLIEIRFEYTAINSEGLEKKWIRPWQLYAWKEGARGYDWDGVYSDLISSLFAASWKATGDFNLRMIAQGNVNIPTKGERDDDPLPYSQVKDKIKWWQMSWYERQEKKFFDAWNREHALEFNRFNELFENKCSAYWFPMFVKPDGTIMKGFGDGG